MDRKITGRIEEGASYAEKCRTAKANSHHMKPPSGPKKEPNLTMGYEKFHEKNVK